MRVSIRVRVRVRGKACSLRENHYGTHYGNIATTLLELLLFFCLPFSRLPRAVRDVTINIY